MELQSLNLTAYFHNGSPYSLTLFIVETPSKAEEFKF